MKSSKEFYPARKYVLLVEEKNVPEDTEQLLSYGSSSKLPGEQKLNSAYKLDKCSIVRVCWSTAS